MPLMASQKSEDFPPSVPAPNQPNKPQFYNSFRNLLVLTTCIALSLAVKFTYQFINVSSDALNVNLCPQVEVLAPTKHAELWADLGAAIGTDQFKARVVEWLGGAVRIPTESFDDMDAVGKDPRWDTFGPFHEYLVDAFPRVHESLKLTKVNTYGLLYEWKGSDDTLKPLLLAAHQDVVPVDQSSVDQWTHPPYSGYFDGERLWGRGSSDDKSGLIGILSTVEALLEKNFKPIRTVVLSFGFDEEASGVQGAGSLAPVLFEAYGEDGIAMIVDEGSGFGDHYGSVFATPGIAEKGYIDVLVEVATPGGHSSIPPAHTSIGILSALLVHYESNPYEVHLGRHEPVYDTLQCVAQYAKSLPEQIRQLLKASAYSNEALEAIQSIVLNDRTLKSLVGTTQAVDMIHGGVKSNALPEQAWAIVNHRISVVSSLAEVQAHNTALLKPLADKFNLTYNAFGSRISEEGASASGSLTLSDAFAGGLEPAPVTPTGKDAAPYRLLSGTIKAAYNSHRSLIGSDTITVVPSMMSGNTDTQFYWKLSPHIFRYGHQNEDKNSEDYPLGNIHTVNESINIDALLEMIRFFATLILNADESITM